MSTHVLLVIHYARKVIVRGVVNNQEYEHFKGMNSACSELITLSWHDERIWFFTSTITLHEPELLDKYFRHVTDAKILVEY